MLDGHTNLFIWHASAGVITKSTGFDDNIAELKVQGKNGKGFFERVYLVLP